MNKKELKEILNNIPTKLRDFVGRETNLDQIEDLFKNGKKIIAISAFGGTGKSSLALEYAHKLSNDMAYWFHADSIEKFEKDYKELAENFDIEAIGLSIDIIIRNVNNALKELDTNILFIMDNLESYDYVQKFINNLPDNAKVLITTRNDETIEDVYKIDLEPFNINDAINYIKKNLKEIVNESQIERIIEMTKSEINQILPIKLERVVKYIINTIDKENKENININKVLLQIEGKDFHNNKVENVLFTFLKINNPNSFLALQYCALLNPDYIPIELIQELLKNENNIEQINEYLNRLNRQSLIKKIFKNKKLGLTIHRIVQEQLLNYMCKCDDDVKDEESLLNDILNALDKLFKLVSFNYNGTKENMNYYIQVNDILKQNDSLIKSRPKEIKLIIGSLFNKIGAVEFNVNSNFKKSLENYRKARDLRVMNIDEADCDSVLATYYNNIGIALRYLANHDEALNHLKIGYSMRLKLYPNQDNNDLAASLISLGSLYGNMSKYQESLDHYLKALDIYYKINGENDHSLIATCLSNIGYSHFNLGNNQKSLEYRLKALEMRKRIYNDKDNLEFAESLNGVGSIYSILGEHEKGLEFKIKGYEMRKRIHGTRDHSNLAISLKNVGLSFIDLGKYHESLNFFMKSYEMRLRIFPENHLETAKTIDHIGLAYTKMGNITIGLEWRFKALEMKNKLFPNGHAEIGITLSDIGTSYFEMNDFYKSLKYYLRGYTMRVNLYKADHYLIVKSLKHIANVYEKLKDEVKVSEFNLKAREMEIRLDNK